MGRNANPRALASDEYVMTLSRTFSFEAAHRLLDRPICVEEGERIHGHSYRVEITLCGTASEKGMILDSDLLHKLGKKIVDLLDHRFLNDVPDLGEPTMENIAKWIFDRARASVSGATSGVRVWRPTVGDSVTLSIQS